VDLSSCRTVPQSTHQTSKAFQVYRDLHDHAEERGWSAHGQLVLLGQHNGRELYSPVGEQDHVLHCIRLRPFPLVAGLTEMIARGDRFRSLSPTVQRVQEKQSELITQPRNLQRQWTGNP